MVWCTTRDTLCTTKQNALVFMKWKLTLTSTAIASYIGKFNQGIDLMQGAGGRHHSPLMCDVP
jgi:hypothetical protein